MGKSTVLISDNDKLVTYIKKQVSTISQAMSDLAQDILSWAEQFLVFLSARYILGGVAF